MKLNFDSPADEAQIQIIPLIDVIFCILTFFILAALQLTRQQGINLDLPRATTSAVQMQDMLVVTIDSTGQTYVDKQIVDRAQLFQFVQNYHRQQPAGLLVLRASQTAFYNDVIQVLDILRAVGGDRVALATEASDQAPGQNPTKPGQNPITPGTPIPKMPAPNLVTPVPSAIPLPPLDNQPSPNSPNLTPATPGAPTQPAPSGSTPQNAPASGVPASP